MPLHIEGGGRRARRVLSFASINTYVICGIVHGSTEQISWTLPHSTCNLKRCSPPMISCIDDVSQAVRRFIVPLQYRSSKPSFSVVQRTKGVVATKIYRELLNANIGLVVYQGSAEKASLTRSHGTANISFCRTVSYNCCYNDVFCCDRNYSARRDSNPVT